MNKFFLSVCFVTMVAVAPVWAADTEAEMRAADNVKAAEPDPESFPVLKKIKGEAKDLTYDYLGRSDGIDAWLLSGSGFMQVIYIPVTQAGGAVIGGTLVDENGNPVSEKLQSDFTHHYPKRAAEILNAVRTPLAEDQKAASPSEIMWQKFIEASPIVVGAEKDTPVVIAVLDPAQPQTRKVWNALNEEAQKKTIQLRIMPLALTSPDSIIQIATLIGHPNPGEAWTHMLEGKVASGDGPMNPETANTMKKIIELATTLKLRRLPFFVYRGAAEGSPVKVMRGEPKDWGVFLDGLKASAPVTEPEVEESEKKD